MNRSVKGMLAAVAGCVLWSAAAAGADVPAQHTVHLSQAPLVMRLSKDEFRIVFGIDTQHCLNNGCSGVIRYRVAWKTDDGTTISELKSVSYSVPPHYGRAMTVDRQYFDTAEGAHTTHLIRVRVADITCRETWVQPAQTVARSDEL